MKYITVLFKKHKKKLPQKLQGTWIAEFYRYGFMIFLSAWLLQGVRITNWREIVIRYALDLILTSVFILIGFHWIIALFVAHTINFAFNGQLFAMFTHMGVTNVPPDSFLKNTIAISKKIEKQKFIRASIAYGSLSRGCYKSTSDIDIRLIPAEGGWWATAFYAVWLRIWAFLVHYPLDMYCYDPEVVIKKMRTDELPIMVTESEKCMMKWYPKRVEFDTFVKRFTEANIH